MGIGKGSLSGTTSNFSRRNTSTHTSTKPPTGWTSIEDLGRHCERLDRRAGSESRYYYDLRNPVCPKCVPEKLKQPPTPKKERDGRDKGGRRIWLRAVDKQGGKGVW